MSNPFWRDDLIQPSLDTEVDAAIREQLEILAKDPQNAKAFFALGTLSNFRGKTDDAILYLSQAIELDPTAAAPHLNLGRIYAMLSKYDEAWHHARLAEALGSRELVEMLERYPNLKSSAPANP
jgi:tetratricopeptide (TPR) repeat protein